MTESCVSCGRAAHVGDHVSLVRNGEQVFGGPLCSSCLQTLLDRFQRDENWQRMRKMPQGGQVIPQAEAAKQS